MTNIQYEDGSGMRGPSAFWGELQPWYGINPNDGWGGFDDFLDSRTTAVHNLVLEEADDNAAWAPITGEECGVWRLTIASDDNEEGSMQWGNTNVAAPLVIDEGYGRMWFEARVRFSSVTDNVLGMVLGLAEEGFAASNCIIDNGAAATTDGTGIVGKDFVGFGVWADDGDTCDAFYHTAGATAATHKAQIGTLVASTWIKLGMYFDGQSQLWFYVDGVRYGTSVLASATDFPDGEELSPVFAIKVSSNAALNADIDWWAFAQEAVVGSNC